LDSSSAELLLLERHGHVNHAEITALKVPTARVVRG